MVKRKRKGCYSKASSMTIRNWTIYRLKGYVSLLEEISTYTTNQQAKDLADMGLSITEDLIEAIKKEEKL